MQSSTDVFQDVVRYLDTHEEALRIKKLIYCICNKAWENDAKILNSISLEDLIHELVKQKATNEQLTFEIYKLVRTLNRPKVYANVASIIIDQVGKLYNKLSSIYDTDLLGDGEETIITIKSEEVTNDTDTILNNVVDFLETHREGGRIKKLLFAICKNRWENDAEAIDKTGLKNLILEIPKNNPSLEIFKTNLHKIVENINKKTVYLAVADLLIICFEPLYNKDISQDKLNLASRAEIVHLSNENSSARDESFDGASGFATSIIDFQDSRSMSEFQVAETTPFSMPDQITPKEYDPFELKLEVLQYTNPLRVKILLFSILFHPWEQSGQDWVNLRNHTLEEMLEQLIHSRQSLKDIETQLQHAAQTRVDSDANIQTVGILIQSLQRLF